MVFDNSRSHGYNPFVSTRIPPYTMLDHTADLAVQVQGTDPKDLFENAGLVLVDLMVRGPVSAETTLRHISLSGKDFVDLLVRWLGEILYLFDGESLVVTSLEIRLITPERLEGIVSAVPFDPRTHAVLREVKAVTYHRAEVSKKGERWEARVILDI